MDKGLYPALVTPFKPNEELDENALIDCVEKQMRMEISGFYVGGSTGEFILMSLEERKRLLEIVCQTAKGKKAVVAHIGCQRPRDSIELARHAAENGACAVSSLPPLYFKYTLDELIAYYAAIADAVDLPLIVYNAPALANVEFNAENTRPLFRHERISGMKFTSYNLFEMQKILAEHPDKILINGHDELFLNTLSFGLKHAIGSTFNFMANKFAAIRRTFLAGDMDRAYALQLEANQVISALMEVGVFRGVKGMMRIQGMPVGDCRAPFKPLTLEEMHRLEAVAPLAEC